jgi:hypothetical protein
MRNDLAVWSGAFAFFGTLLAVGIFDVLDPAKRWEYLAAIIVAFITAGSVYTKQQMDDAKAKREAEEASGGTMLQKKK